MYVVEVEELTKIYPTRMKKGNITALDSISLNVEVGEIFGLLGPNGAGKTTLLKILLGITGITSGQALVNGLSPRDPESRRKVGFLPENHNFPNYLTGLGLVEYTGRMHGLSQQEIDRRSEDILKTVGMERWASTKIRKYSKGMIQRIGLAQAMIVDPDVLFLDEPTDGVDPVGKMEIRQVLQKLRTEGKTIFLNSHLLSEVESVADRVAILDRGKVKRIDTVEALTSRKSQFQVEAELGDLFFTLPEEIGKVVSLSSKGLLVELIKDENINYVIDQLRMKRIKIRSVRPQKISLEQSFFETVSEKQEPQA